jgi:hypothetical protein
MERGRSITLSHTLRLDAFQQQFKRGLIHLTRGDLPPIAKQPPSLQSLAPNVKPHPVKVKHLDFRASAIDKHEQIASQRILASLISRQCVQAVK